MTHCPSPYSSRTFLFPPFPGDSNLKPFWWCSSHGLYNSVHLESINWPVMIAFRHKTLTIFKHLLTHRSTYQIYQVIDTTDLISYWHARLLFIYISSSLKDHRDTNTAFPLYYLLLFSESRSLPNQQVPVLSSHRCLCIRLLLFPVPYPGELSWKVRQIVWPTDLLTYWPTDLIIPATNSPCKHPLPCWRKMEYACWRQSKTVCLEIREVREVHEVPVNRQLQMMWEVITRSWI